MQILLWTVALAGAPECDLLNVSRVWYPAVQCVVGQQLNYSRPVQNEGVFRLVNIGRLASKVYAGTTVWSAAALGPQARISDSVFAINAVVNLTGSGSQAHTVEVFKTGGAERLERVALFGNVTLLLGDMTEKSFSITARPWEGFQSASAAQVSIVVGTANLSTAELCTTATPNTTWCLGSAESGCYLYGNNESRRLCVQGMGPLWEDVRAELARATQLQVQVYERRLGRLQSLTLTIPGPLNEMESAYADLYGGMLQLVAELQFETYGLAEAWYDAELGVNFQGRGKRLFFSATKGVLMQSPVSPLVCTDEYVDLVGERCVPSCAGASRKKHHMRFCVESCPGSQNASSAYCECPRHQGYLENCLLCDEGYLSYGTQCQFGESCLEGTVRFGRGCFGECPLGRFGEDDKTCVEPATPAACNNTFHNTRPYLLVHEYGRAPTGRFYNICSATPPHGMYLHSPLVYVQRCDKNVSLNGSCADLGVNTRCAKQGPLALQDGQCRARCLNGQVNNSGLCGPQCPSETYRSSYGVCNQCRTSYDGGAFFVRDGMQVLGKTYYCTDQCGFVNESVCEVQGSEFCPHWRAEDTATMDLTCLDIDCSDYASQDAIKAYTKAETSFACRALRAIGYDGCTLGEEETDAQYGFKFKKNSCTVEQLRCACACPEHEFNKRCYSCPDGQMLDCLGGDCHCTTSCATIYVNKTTGLPSCQTVGQGVCPFQYTEKKTTPKNYCVDSCPTSHIGTQCTACPRYFSRADKMCVPDCKYINSSYYYDICEQGPATANAFCPFAIQYEGQRELGIYTCLAECPEMYQVSGLNCVACGASDYWWFGNKSCSAKPCDYYSNATSRVCLELSWDRCQYYRIENARKVCLQSCEKTPNTIVSRQQCQECPAGSSASADSSTCVCSDTSATVYFNMTAFECQTCTNGQQFIDGDCRCNGTTVERDDQCIPCISGAVRGEDGNCTCGDGFMMGPTHCVKCPSYTTYANGKCKCSPDTYEFNGVECVLCPPGQKLDNKTLMCSCSASEIYIVDYQNANASRCYPCPSTARVVENQCVCNDPGLRFDAHVCSDCPVTQTALSGKCEPLCLSGAKWDSQTLRCICENAHQTFNETTKTCTCPEDQRLDGQQCRCKDAQRIMHAGACIESCPRGFLRLRDECYYGTQCPTGYNNKRNPETCMPTKAPMDMGTASGIGILAAIVVIIIVWGAMICRKYKKGPNKERIQRRHKRHVPKAKISLERHRPAGQVVL